MNGHTHYVPAFTLRVRGYEVAVCNAPVRPGAGSPEPTCPACRDWLEEDAASLEALRSIVGTQSSRVGATVHFSSTAGYRPRKAAK